MGTVMALAISGVLCDSEFLGGWPSSFYVIGSLGLIWAAAWFYLVRDSPAEHPRMQTLEILKQQSMQEKNSKRKVCHNVLLTILLLTKQSEYSKISNRI